MTIWELKSPTIERRGFLPMPTTRGDRFFIGLLTTAFIVMAWLGFTVATPWIALAISLVAMAVIGRWG
jgi:predicted small integral membrane protein